MDSTLIVTLVAAVAVIITVIVALRYLRRKLRPQQGGIQRVNVKQLRVRIITNIGEIFDISFEGKAFYVNDTIWVHSAKESFNDWRDHGEHGLFRVARDRWIGAQSVKDLVVVDERDFFIDVPI